MRAQCVKNNSIIPCTITSEIKDVDINGKPALEFEITYYYELLNGNQTVRVTKKKAGELSIGDSIVIIGKLWFHPILHFRVKKLTKNSSAGGCLL